MKYLSKEPMFFGPPQWLKDIADEQEKRKQVREFGGPAFKIPKEDRCPSGRHSTRLTKCFC